MFRRITFFIWLVYLVIVGILSYSVAVKEVKRRADQQISDVASRLDIELDKFRTLPRVLVLHPSIVDALQTPSNEAIESVNQLLLTYNTHLSSDAVYLLSDTGMTVASSNWQDTDSFIGNDYGFRPYFQKAMEGQDGNYFALGTVSRKRGYYFSFPVKKSDDIIGVLAVKVALSVIEENNINNDIDSNFTLLLTDNHGAIFYSSNPQWNYSALVPLPERVEAELILQKQYGNGPLPVLSQHNDLTSFLNASFVALPDRDRQTTYLVADKVMNQVGWHLLALTPRSQVYQIVVLSLIGATLLFILIALLSLYWRRHVESQRQLSLVNEQLEQRVEQRTGELRQTNIALVDTIEKQKVTEQRLKETQNELIQAGKLALLGEMSASINHELNQPLTALLTYSETLLLMIKKGRTEAFEQTCKEIITITQMMAKIVAQYKLFARKSAGKVGPVRVQDTLKASMAILESKIQKLHADITINNHDDNAQVLAESVPLEQVLVNLLNNALQAQELDDTVKLDITITTLPQHVSISVRDFGPGFDVDDPSRVFEPFYTTKGRGLGLGLTISQRIVESFNGTITAEQHPEGGAVFTITLPRSTA